MEKKYDLVILGSGPAGITAGIYAMRARLDTLLLEKGYVTGGQMLNTFEVDNYPGMPQVTGSEMSAAFERHMRQLGLPIRQGEATKIIPDGKGFCIETEEDTYHASAVIIATGTRHRLLNVPGEKELSGMGVSYCATCDGAFYKGKTVAVVGGGDAAVEDGIFLARICKKVYLIHRRDELRAAKILQERLLGLENVEVLWNHEVKEIAGDEHVTDVEVYDNQKNSRSRLAVDGIFIAVGVQPNSQALEQIAATDRAGYFIARSEEHTSELQSQPQISDYVLCL